MQFFSLHALISHYRRQRKNFLFMKAPSNSRCKKNEIFRWNMIITLPCHSYAMPKKGAQKKCRKRADREWEENICIIRVWCQSSFEYNENGINVSYIARHRCWCHGHERGRKIESISWLLFCCHAQQLIPLKSRVVF